MGAIRDLLYFDVEKAASIYSQISGGLLERIEESVEEGRDERNVRKYVLPFFSPEFGGVEDQRTGRLETRVLHHDLLNRVESWLFEQGLARDLNSEVHDDVESVRRVAESVPYVRATGYSTIEDYQRLKRFSQDFKTIAEFLNRCGLSVVEKSEDYRQLQAELEEMREAAKQIKDRNERAAARDRVKALEVAIKSKIRDAIDLDSLPDWLMTGIGQFIDSFQTGRINLRVVPFEGLPTMEVLANLKRDAFMDISLENLLFAYGTQPTVPLTVVGLVTSVPERGATPWERIRAKQDEAPEETDEAGFEEGFRGVFESMEGMESFVRFARYPRISLYPIAVYRMVGEAPDGTT